ncbi:MAG TPA: methyltransferase domain-containing protein [Acidimicrobiia bacterium]|jgi:SAM-dependent methyltransferase|nr:methyltransferase domain-containing protein [Acidimicrobiia bacterium]
MQLFDLEKTFGDDYLYFYRQRLDEERNKADVDRIVEVLGLVPGDKVLDAPCGHGRIAKLLASRGMEVTGVDATREFIDLAREDATERRVHVSYHVGDLRELGVDGPFDAVVCWFTSFGYFDDHGNQAVLEEFARVLRPGGQLGIEMIHHDGFVRGFTPAPFASTTFRDDNVMIDTSVFDPVTGRIKTDRVVYRDGETRRSQHHVRLPTIPEFDRWLDAAGFGDREYFGRDRSPPTIDDFRLVIVATR